MFLYWNFSTQNFTVIYIFCNLTTLPQVQFKKIYNFSMFSEAPILCFSRDWVKKKNIKYEKYSESKKSSRKNNKNNKDALSKSITK